MSSTPQRYFTSTALEALEAAQEKNKGLTLAGLVDKYGANANPDAVLCDRWRYSLGTLIRSAWRTRRSITSSIADELSCYPETEIAEERGVFVLGEVRCKPQDECALAVKLRARPELLGLLRKAVAAQPSKPENTNRMQVLRELIRLPKQKMTDEQCRRMGDAMFAFFCPADAVILTTNERDLRPLAEALGKTVQTPS